MSTQRFCLRWNNHQSNLLSVFDQLLHEESFVDVTLAVDGQLLRAHKMVLSACSPYFQALFVNHPDKHPIVILKDVPYLDMKNLLDFMYRGEVSVDQDRLTAFLRVAESLRIKGLTEVNEEKCDSITSTLTQSQVNSSLQQFQQKLQPQKRFNAFNMLGNALLQPKRKRGRPRKLSGSSNGTPGADDFDKSDSLVQGSPEMLEVKMGMDGFSGNNSDSNSVNHKEKEDDDLKIKSEEVEQEPVAGTSKEEANANGGAKNDAEFQASDEKLDFLENNQNHSNLLKISDCVTLKLIPQNPRQKSVIIERIDCSEDSQEEDVDGTSILPSLHFLDEDALCDNYEKKKSELLEYVTQKDGSVVCKLCGELLATRTHWYRHKYKVHVNSIVNPAPLLKCKLCNVFFKSRKGYLGHVNSRHGEVSGRKEQEQEICVQEEEEMVEVTKICRKKEEKSGSDWQQERIKEEKLVAAIIDRVKKECEAQGSAVTRRGYTRRNTVMMNTT